MDDLNANVMRKYGLGDRMDVGRFMNFCTIHRLVIGGSELAITSVAFQQTDTIQAITLATLRLAVDLEIVFWRCTKKEAQTSASKGINIWGHLLSFCVRHILQAVAVSEYKKVNVSARLCLKC